ncbi:hypothetical protein Nepgr_003940 [Nepenthes gracilis]|uniref:Uncharacterized protein n=1 Tax=Nepenthes gracilis TaxID=150966 RepID=A0AAD3XEN8_NEPGR|nr:hypothetical protein Nepgr_003940 [Nepenthes gracilis]
MLDPNPDSGVPVPVGVGQSRGSRLGAELNASAGSGVQSIDGAHSPFLDVKMCFGDASVPNTAMDRLATIGSLSCSVQGVGPLDVGFASRLHVVASSPMKAASLKELSCPNRAVAALEVVLPVHGSHNSILPLPEEAGTIERLVDDVNNLVGENRVMDIDSDGASSQSSEGWSAEDIAKDPMYYVLQRLLLEKATQLYVCSMDKDHRASLFDFLDSCWNDARRVVEETCLSDRMENVGTWIQAKSMRKGKVSPKHSKSSSGPSPGL